MNALEIYKHHLVDAADANKYTGIMYYHHCFYFCDPAHRQLVQFDSSFTKKQTHVVKRPYSGICFDNVSNKFYAICQNDDKFIYVLNSNFEETDCLEICFSVPVELLSVDCGNGLLYLTTKEAVYTYRIWVSLSPTCYLKSSKPLVCAIDSRKHLVTLSHNGHCELVKVYDKHLHLQVAYCLEKGYRCISMCEDGIYIYILCQKGCETFVIVCAIKSEKPKDRECQSYCDVIESIALSQAALAHILNAEGEKLQKAIACCDCIDKLLETNDSVYNMVVSITHLEQVLYDKLKIASAMQKCEQKTCCCEDQNK